MGSNQLVARAVFDGLATAECLGGAGHDTGGFRPATVGGRRGVGNAGIQLRPVSYLRGIPVVPSSALCGMDRALASGIAILTRSWPFLLMPLVAYGVFKALIGREELISRSGLGKLISTIEPGQMR